MDMLQWETFLGVADEDSFTRAAERVFRTQPAVSQKLGEPGGVPLFARDRLDPTEAGHALVDNARRISRREDSTRKVGELHNLEAGDLGLNAHHSPAVHLLPGPLCTHSRQFPLIEVGLYGGLVEEMSTDSSPMVSSESLTSLSLPHTVIDSASTIAAGGFPPPGSGDAQARLCKSTFGLPRRRSN